jgi:hypothetical protein
MGRRVNFVFHLHLAARDLGSPTAGAGAMLPDLWRMADRRVRAQTAPREAPGDAAPALSRVLAGIEHHLRVDRWFHADAVFRDGEQEASALIGAAHLAAPRSGLFAHVLWELCLDGALLRREGFPTVLGLLREGAAGLAGAGGTAAELHHFDRVARTADERAAFDDRLRRIVAELERGPWIESYQTGAGVAGCVQGVRRGLGLTPMDAADLARLAAVAEQLLGRAPAVVERILDARSS